MGTTTQRVWSKYSSHCLHYGHAHFDVSCLCAKLHIILVTPLTAIPPEIKTLPGVAAPKICLFTQLLASLLVLIAICFWRAILEMGVWSLGQRVLKWRKTYTKLYSIQAKAISPFLQLISNFQPIRFIRNHFGLETAAHYIPLNLFPSLLKFKFNLGLHHLI